MNPSKIYPSYHYGLAILKDAMKCKYYYYKFYPTCLSSFLRFYAFLITLIALQSIDPSRYCRFIPFSEWYLN